MPAAAANSSGLAGKTNLCTFGEVSAASTLAAAKAAAPAAASQTLARGMAAQGARNGTQGVRRGSVLGGAVAAGNVFRSSAKKVVNAIILEQRIEGDVKEAQHLEAARQARLHDRVSTLFGSKKHNTNLQEPVKEAAPKHRPFLVLLPRSRTRVLWDLTSLVLILHLSSPSFFRPISTNSSSLHRLQMMYGISLPTVT